MMQNSVKVDNTMNFFKVLVRQSLTLSASQVRASLETLRKDKLIKSITKGEKEELGPGGGVLKFNHYFIR